MLFLFNIRTRNVSFRSFFPFFSFLVPLVGISNSLLIFRDCVLHVGLYLYVSL